MAKTGCVFMPRLSKSNLGHRLLDYAHSPHMLQAHSQPVYLPHVIPMRSRIKMRDPMTIPKMARPIPCLVGSCLISRIAMIPVQIANGAGRNRIDKSPKYPAAMAHPDRPTGKHIRSKALVPIASSVFRGGLSKGKNRTRLAGTQSSRPFFQTMVLGRISPNSTS